ncbi:hypothetical protein [Modestobacter roseus]|uniref:Uncharacterized protein n=1 Tax=Modestobacter roseus TaxID=1181884 RepID=A0A562IQL0_9ACTN|nr:hypothetical protein [Modestobacter roseus]MQA35611.1 hypothetical protein [Modestobacter roseus]TWH73096.1 hypothetical protein JD78_01619 [Modestobacter roseus]
MDLITRLATRRTAVLVVEVPGWAATRWAVEREVRDRGWRPALSPADADVLVVCGRPGARLATAVDHVWTQLPGPRARAALTEPASAAGALDAALTQLTDRDAQRRDAVDRPDEPSPGTGAAERVEGEPTPSEPQDDEPPAFDDPGPAQEDDGDSDAGEPGDMDHGDMDHGGMDHGGMDHGGMDHGGMYDHGDMDMDMPMPGGIMLAGAGGNDQLPDPDGLDLDVLHLPLGPVLPSWPAGLLLHTTLQGDLVVAAVPEVLPADGAPPSAQDVRRSPAGRWDAVATLLALAGWDDAATRAARLRDAALDGELHQGDADRLARRIRRSRLLRASLRGLGELPDGDAHDRLLHWLDGAAAERTTTLGDVAELVTGLDLAAARLVVASLDLDTAHRTPAPAEATS